MLNPWTYTRQLAFKIVVNKKEKLRAQGVYILLSPIDKALQKA